MMTCSVMLVKVAFILLHTRAARRVRGGRQRAEGVRQAELG